MPKEEPPLSQAQQIDCTRQPVGTDSEGVCRLYPNRNALGNGSLNRGKES